LDTLLPAKTKIRKPQHHAALPFNELGTFIEQLRSRNGVAAAALEFLILTAARTGEVLHARWSEIDFTSRAWTVPAARMKAGKEHRVPLSSAAMRVLETMHQRREGDLIFPGAKTGKSLSNMSLLVLLRRMGHGDLTAHGFRATFRTWCGERTGVAREIAEAALAHSAGSKVERAYQRGDLFEKRIHLMSAWADFCSLPSADMTKVVVPLRAST
jgi:integrase